MGTSYYLFEKEPCKCCGRDFPAKHIGKSSVGWVFALHVIPEENINDIDDWVKLWSQPKAIIKDEYDRVITAHRMLEIIKNRNHAEYWDNKPQKPFGYNNWWEFHKENESFEGPNGLLRGRLSDRCIKHGNGTWDCYTGEFS